jgi:hypothetical protein
MNRREFNKTLKSCLTKKNLDKAKLAALPDDTKFLMVNFLVRKRAPVLIELIGPLTDKNWLAAMGYLYQTKGKEFEFIHTGEHKII